MPILFKFTVLVKNEVRGFKLGLYITERNYVYVKWITYVSSKNFMGIRSNGVTQISLYATFNYGKESSCRATWTQLHRSIWGVAKVQNFNKGSLGKTAQTKKEMWIWIHGGFKPLLTLAGIVSYNRTSCGLESSRFCSCHSRGHVRSFVQAPH